MKGKGVGSARTVQAKGSAAAHVAKARWRQGHDTGTRCHPRPQTLGNSGAQGLQKQAGVSRAGRGGGSVGRHDGREDARQASWRRPNKDEIGTRSEDMLCDHMLLHSCRRRASHPGEPPARRGSVHTRQQHVETWARVHRLKPLPCVYRRHGAQYARAPHNQLFPPSGKREAMRCGTGPLQRQAPSEGERLIGKEQASCLERPGRTCKCWTDKTETPVGSTRRRRKAHRHGARGHMRESKGGQARDSARAAGAQGSKAAGERLSGSLAAKRPAARRNAAGGRRRSTRAHGPGRSCGGQETRGAKRADDSGWADRGGRGARA